MIWPRATLQFFECQHFHMHVHAVLFLFYIFPFQSETSHVYFFLLLHTRCESWLKKSPRMVSSKCFAVMLIGFLQLYLLAQCMNVSYSCNHCSNTVLSAWIWIIYLIDDFIYVLRVVNIGATALVTEAATSLFGEAGVSAATGVMTVCPISFLISML